MPNIVVIGAGMAGATVARELAKKLPPGYVILLLEAGQVAYWPPAALRAAVAPNEDWETKVVLTYDRFWPPGSPHKVLPATRVERLEEHAVVLQSGETIEFEYAVLATGSRNPFPSRAGRPLGGGEASWAATVQGLKHLQESVERARHVLVVGGGAVGVEYAGEIGHFYASDLARGAKRVTLVSRGKELCGAGWGASLHNKLQRQLRNMHVRLILEDEVDIGALPPLQSPARETGGAGAIPPTTLTTRKGQELTDVDFVLAAVGPDASNPLLGDAFPGGDVTRAGIQPDVHLRLSGPLKNYFVLGDAADLAYLGVPKMIVPLSSHAAVVAGNIAALIQAKVDGKKEEEVPLQSASAPPRVMIVTLGPCGGAFVTPFWTFGEWMASLLKSRSLFLGAFTSAFVAS